MMLPMLLDTWHAPAAPVTAPVLVRSPATLNLATLPHATGTFALAREKVAYRSPNDGTSIRVTEWGAGEWPYATAIQEFCQILSGGAVFLLEGGEPIPLNTGDAILFYPGTVGRWVVVKALRRLSVTLPRPL